MNKKYILRKPISAFDLAFKLKHIQGANNTIEFNELFQEFDVDATRKQIAEIVKEACEEINGWASASAYDINETTNIAVDRVFSLITGETKCYVCNDGEGNSICKSHDALCKCETNSIV